jgi:hypothetical protein
MFRKIALSLIVILVSSVFGSAQRPILKVGVLNKRAIYLPEPVFPAGCRCKGIIKVTVLIDVQSGKVVEAKTKAGNPLLRVAAVKAALLARFTPVTYTGKASLVKGILIYNFNADGFVKSDSKVK